MAERMDVERALADLAENVRWPDSDVSEAVMARVARESGWRRERRVWRPAAAAVAVGIAVLVLLVPGPRRALAGLLEIIGIRIEATDGLTGLEVTDLGLEHPIDLPSAQRAVSFVVRTPSDLPSPPAVFLEPAADTARVVMVWPVSDELPESLPGSGAGLVLEQFSARLEEVLVRKVVPDDTDVNVVSVDGSLGYWLEGGPHQLGHFDNSGAPVIETTRLAGNVLVWEVNGVTHRLESSLGLDRALELAASLQPAL